MDWTNKAEAALKKVPFLVRKKVRLRVEQQARAAGKSRVTLEDVNTARKRFLAGMEKEIKGYQVETCFGQGGCPNRITDSTGLIQRIEKVLAKADLLEFLKTRVKGPLKFHHEFRVAIADCPNACSQPQIKDIGLIAARRPGYRPDNSCSACGACAQVCRENALVLNNGKLIGFLADRCVACGQCLNACPSQTLAEEATGFRIQLGGKLGRHPCLAMEMDGIFNQDQLVRALELCLEIYKDRSRNGQRLGEIIKSSDLAVIAAAVRPA